MKFAVTGGDMRQAKLAELLAFDGHEVAAFAIDRTRLAGVTRADTVRDAVSGADCVVLPLPASSKEGILNAPLSAGTHTVREVLAAVSPRQLVCAGRADAELRALASDMGLTLVDYFEREELAVENAAATAEGAVQLIMEELPITLSGAECLVIGYGRIGKILCHRLRGMGARVTASARKYSDAAWIRALGFSAADTRALEGTLGRYDVVVNTVPARVLGESRLKELRPGCLCLDLASKPGGMDFDAASRLGIKAVWALSLPGEVAPVTAGAAIRDTIYNILTEWGAAQ